MYVVAFMDLKKAYDKVYRKKLRKLLQECECERGAALRENEEGPTWNVNARGERL